MLCIHPIKPRQLGGQQVACGRCMNCRINHKLKWLGRMALEAEHAKQYVFITLTYATEHLPRHLDLSRAELKSFLDKLRRKGLGPGMRYFAVGEYGTEGEREVNPHYHVILYGHSYSYELLKRCQEAWSVHAPRTGELLHQKGRVTVENPRSRAAMAYVLGYVTKKLTSKSDERLTYTDANGVEHQRAPEFFHASNQPPLGRAGLNHIARMCNTQQGAAAIAEKGFPRGFTKDGQYYPFHRADRDYVMDQAGYGDDYEEHLEDMQEHAWLQFETYALYHQAERFGWSAAKLRDMLKQMTRRLDAEALERKRIAAEARAEKRRRKWLKNKKAAGGPKPPQGERDPGRVFEVR